jgi:hypothetical protein
LAEAIRPFAVRVDSLKRDPNNTNLHGDGDLPTTANSLRRFGQRPSGLIEFDPETRIIKVGSGRHEAAETILAWKWIAAVPSDLGKSELKAFAIVHNRSGRLSDVNLDELERQLAELSSELPDFDQSDTGWEKERLQALKAGDFEKAHDFAPKKPKPDPEAGPSEYTAVHKIILSCPNERFHSDLIDAIEKNNAGDPTKLGKLMKNIEYTAPNVD